MTFSSSDFESFVDSHAVENRLLPSTDVSVNGCIELNPLGGTTEERAIFLCHLLSEYIRLCDKYEEGKRAVFEPSPAEQD